ncbi:hypothetical protein HHK36_000720 [Tetracentron sinense]|uniref:Ubiquitin-like protease family profile domain-containing protein n=1 Tax=Tetracentron sinense TaxID=13715 RepID=A0A834ZSP5_TETSI|nr:hypothetical protein HHK36_000720 [Tetracentron sinense]
MTPMLTPEEEKVVEEAWGSKETSKILYSFGKWKIDIGTTQSLQYGMWLGSEVVDLYALLLKERELNYHCHYKCCHFFPYHFLIYLTQNHLRFKNWLDANPKAKNCPIHLKLDQAKVNSSMEEWIDPESFGYRISECENLIFPINKNSHWALGVLNVQDGKLMLLDSIYSDTLDRYKPEIDAISNFLPLLMTSYGMSLKVKTKIHLQNAPKQTGGNDCGIFLLKYMDCVARGIPITFSSAEEDINLYRRKIAYEVLERRAFHI